MMKMYFILLALGFGIPAISNAEMTSHNLSPTGCCDCPTKTCGCYNQVACDRADASVKVVQKTVPTGPVTPGEAGIGNN